MAIDVIAGAATQAGSRLGLQDFLKILLTQLHHQDPLKPMDNQAFMAQMAQFSALEQGQRVADKLDLLIGNQAALQSLGLIGRTVEAAVKDGNVTGTVTSLSLQGEAPVVSIMTSAGKTLTDVGLSQLTAVR